MTYVKTVAKAPRTIFFLSTACLTLSLCFLSLVRLYSPVRRDAGVAEANGSFEQRGGSRTRREDTLVDTGVPDIVIEDVEGRGRKLGGKKLTSRME